MPRTYKKRNIKYSKVFVIKKAMEDIKEGKLSLRKAAEKYAIDKSKLSCIITVKHSGTQGQRTVLSKNEEKHLADHLKTLAKWGFSLSKAEVLNVVQDYISLNGIRAPFKNNQPGDNWFCGFVCRNNMTVKRVEPL